MPDHPIIETLRGYGAFTRVITRGKRLEKRPIKAYILTSESKTPCVRVGYAVSREINRATRRNYLKRVMREAFRGSRDIVKKNADAGVLQEIVFLYKEQPGTSRKSDRYSAIVRAVSGICAALEESRAGR